MVIIMEAYRQTWGLCLVLVCFFGVVTWGVWRGRDKVPARVCPPRAVFWVCTLVGFLLLGVCLTLIDKPLLNNSEEMKDWLFMFSAFLGIPLALPLFSGAAWSAAHRYLGAEMKTIPFALLMLGTFAMGTAASNLHDVLWCATYTEGYTRHAAAGYDLDLFVAAGWPFGIPREVMADYATLGPVAMILVSGELVVAWACFTRLARR